MALPTFVKSHQRMLTSSEEHDLFERWRTARDTHDVKMENRLFEQIIKQYSPIVVKITRKMAGYRLDYDDMMGEALMALSRAVIDFDPSKGFRFGTYANSCIQNYLYTYVTKNYFMTNVCSNSKNKKVFFRLRRLMSEHIREFGNTPMTQELAQTLADQLNVDAETIIMMATILRNPYSSLNQPVGSQGDEEDTGLTQQDLLVSLEKPQDLQVETIQLRQLHNNLIEQALSVLDERTRNIVRDQVLQPNGQRITLEELGDKYNISKERARQIREKGLSKINTFIHRELKNRHISTDDLFINS